MTAAQATVLRRRFSRRFKTAGVTYAALLVACGQCRDAAADEAVPSICLDSIGYLPESTKRATVADPGIDSFQVQNVVTGAEVVRGRLKPIVAGTDGNRKIFVADFSELRQPGAYVLAIPGGNTSASFVVAEDAFNWPFYCVARGMYLWRCGTAVAGEFGDHTFQHAACHLDDALLDPAGGLAGERKDGVGGWHDAGDYNKYTVNAAFTAGMMLTAWEHFRDRLEGLNLNLPESDNALPDVLDEIRWELEWLLKMQAENGSVYHKLSTLKFGGRGLPDKEKAPRYYSPWGSAATASFAAVMAQAARVYHPFDEEFAARCLAAAEKSFEFLRAHGGDHRPDQSAFATGGYDSPDTDDRLWAAAELWETTGKPEYLHDLEQRVQARSVSARGPSSTLDSDWDWGHVRNLGVFTYLLSERDGRDPAVVARVRDDATRTADAIVDTAGRHPYARPLGNRYYWGSNGTVARQAMNLEVAHRISGNLKYRAAMLDALHYLFGRNPYGRSFVTGLGHAPPLHPHDRRSGGDDVDMPWPGYLVGGPWPKATDWHDVVEDFRTNEIAINWNGALIYALAAFVEPESFAESVAQDMVASEAKSARNKDAE